MQRLEVSGAIRPIYGSLGVKRLICFRYQPNDGPIGQNMWLSASLFCKVVFWWSIYYSYLCSNTTGCI